MKLPSSPLPPKPALIVLNDRTKNRQINKARGRILRKYRFVAGAKKNKQAKHGWCKFPTHSERPWTRTTHVADDPTAKRGSLWLSIFPKKPLKNRTRSRGRRFLCAFAIYIFCRRRWWREKKSRKLTELMANGVRGNGWAKLPTLGATGRRGTLVALVVNAVNNKRHTQQVADKRQSACKKRQVHASRQRRFTARTRSKKAWKHLFFC